MALSYSPYTISVNAGMKCYIYHNPNLNLNLNLNVECTACRPELHMSNYLLYLPSLLCCSGLEPQRASGSFHGPGEGKWVWPLLLSGCGNIY